MKLFVSSNINGKIVEKRLKEVINDIGLHAHVEIHHQDPPTLNGFYYTPTLVVNDKVVSSGKVLSKQEMTNFFL
ncbi:thioredoxin family protein [Evansella cellulosilytica]|uniref:thioredoxin family protein n=1 Tax=Evansella cellulosilytica TaxID=1413 RepID=UPI001FDEC7B5|nr:thioredoxin family protein [Evansella cellulosilytica]